MSMNNRYHRASAKAAAERFLLALQDLAAREAVLNDRGGYACPKEQGAARRASMDLTRALAELRRP